MAKCKSSHRTHYFERDGNGGFLISKSMLAMIVTLFVLGGYVFNSVMTYAIMQSNIEDHNTKILSIESYLETVSADHQIRMAYLIGEISQNHEDVQIINTKLDFISDDLKDIKATLKNTNTDTTR